MNWSRVKCAVFGHKWQVIEGRQPADVEVPADCVRCAAHRPGIDWNRPRVLGWGISIPPMPHIPRRAPFGGNVNPPPAYPRPAPPPAPPARKDVITLKVELDGLEEAKAEVAKLHAHWTQVLAMQEVARRID